MQRSNASHVSQSAPTKRTFPRKRVAVFAALKFLSAFGAKKALRDAEGNALALDELLRRHTMRYSAQILGVEEGFSQDVARLFLVPCPQRIAQKNPYSKQVYLQKTWLF